jgi:aqualysin 1
MRDVGPRHAPYNHVMTLTRVVHGHSVTRARRISALVAVAGIAALAGGAVVAPVNANVERSSYIVVLDTRADASLLERRAVGLGGRVTFSYRHAINGFAVDLPNRAAAALASAPGVRYVEPDGVASVVATPQNPATWGLDRIDQESLPLNASYVYSSTASGVTAYVIDTGVLSAHEEFEGRVAKGYSAIKGGTGTEDCNGHGTHVAGTIAGKTYGVAKKATIVPVRVLGCSGQGSWSGVIAGLDWAAQHHADGAPAVANLSLGGGVSDSVDQAVRGLIQDGVTVVVAAGNSNADACNTSPARVLDAMTVGATTDSDARAGYSNFGTCLDIFAPGSGITSAWHSSTTAINTISGTSMAAPHVAGAAALYLSSVPTADPAEVARVLVADATKAKVTSAGAGSPNLLLFIFQREAAATPEQEGDTVVEEPTTKPSKGNGSKKSDR